MSVPGRNTVAALLVAIGSSSIGCGADPLIVRPDVPAGTPPSHLQERFTYYQSGYFRYDEGTCWFIAADRGPPGREFRCGSLSLGLELGTTVDAIADLVAEECMKARFRAKDSASRRWTCRAEAAIIN